MRPLETFGWIRLIFICCYNLRIKVYTEESMKVCSPSVSPELWPVWRSVAGSSCSLETRGQRGHTLMPYTDSHGQTPRLQEVLVNLVYNFGHSKVVSTFFVVCYWPETESESARGGWRQGERGSGGSSIVHIGYLGRLNCLCRYEQSVIHCSYFSLD